ncbi:MAG: SUF system NifU family Fe-S cluster assembly protein [Elusimicrobia bacterium RIFCSPLOWO2_01_FULL_54_10]|nr:MAG: SUF system NifU family Fe-S cluster assembly protein [Elusimicrobia bacterium RIFCSPLOWO2_01_FULL_54_10]
MEIPDELYREVILDHYRSPRHHGKMEKPDVLEWGKNPLCGDELELYLTVNGDKITDLKFDGKGCSISQASASMMTEAVVGKSLAQVKAIVSDFKGMMMEGKPADALPDDLEDAKSLEGVQKYPVRIKCALLSWNTLLEALKKLESRKAA